MRMLAILKSQWVETYRNPTLILMPLIVVATSFVYSLMNVADDDGYFPTFLLTMTVIMVGTQLPSLSMAEEKEKRTMEAILLTPVRPLEIIAAKLVITALLCAITGGASVLVVGSSPVDPLLAVLAVLLGFLLYGAIGVIIGLLSKDQKTAGIIGAPIVMFLMFGTILPTSEVPAIVGKVMAWLPTRPLQELLLAAFSTAEFQTVRNTLVMLPYIILSYAIAVYLLRRQASAR